jgi:DNA-binding response OmpR family regulator
VSAQRDSGIADRQLPVVNCPSPVPGTPPLPAPTILIVDDESAFAGTLADILGTRGYQTLTAPTGEEGAQAVRRTQVDLAIVDMRLPDLTGVEVLARIREHSPRTEVIILTGHASLDTAVRCLNLGAFGYIEKPYDIDRLFLLIERALGRRTRKCATGRLASLARLLDESAVPAFAYYPDNGQIAIASTAFARLIGFADADVQGVSVFTLLGKSGPEAVADHLTRPGTPAGTNCRHSWLAAPPSLPLRC